MKSKVVDGHITTRSTRSKKASIVEETDIEKNQFVTPNEMEVAPSKNKPRKGVSRSSPHPLYDSLRLLSNSQKNTLVDMGFGFLIGMNIHSVPSILSSYLVRNFNQSLMCIELRNDSIEITPKLVKEVLGIPFGGQGLVKRSNKELKVRWKAQFNKRPTPKVVAEMIKKTDEAGIMFKLNFFVVFYNAMCASQEDGRANIDILDYISEDLEISNLDWCTFVFDCLKHTRKPKIYFCGSVTLLMLIYLNWTKCDEVNVMRSRPAITSWTSDLMKDREDFEIENGGFGNLEVLPLDDEVFKEQSSQKDLQFVEDKIEANLFILSNEKNKLQKFITDSILMFPDNIKLKGLKGMFDDLFCREKVHDPEFSHDLNVIGTIAADANREDQGIAADVDDPTVKERNHVDPECSHDLNVIIGTIAADVNREHQGIAADVEDPTVKIRNHDDQDVEAMEILDYIEIPGWPTKRGRDNEIEDVEALKRKCTGQRNAIVAETASANQSQILSAAQLSQALQTAEPSQANVAQASPTTKTSQTSILHASPTYKDDKENCEKDWNMDGLKSMLGL